MKPTPRKLAEIAHVETALKGFTCATCGAALYNIHLKCSAPLDVRCPGFEAIDKAKADFHRTELVTKP